MNRTFNDKLYGGAMHDLYETYHRWKDSDMYTHNTCANRTKNIPRGEDRNAQTLKWELDVR